MKFRLKMENIALNLGLINKQIRDRIMERDDLLRLYREHSHGKCLKFALYFKELYSECWTQVISTDVDNHPQN